jgi:SAM-dependent methyltransferase
VISNFWKEHGHWKIDPGETVLEVGPGKFPCPYATHWVDIVPNPLVPLCEVANVESLPFADKQFNVAVCSHVLEHTDYPERAISELQRVAKRGVIEVPSAQKDWLCQHGNVHTRWQILMCGNGLVFVEMNPSPLPALLDKATESFAWNCIWNPRNEVENDLNALYWSNLEFFNPTIYWSPESPVRYKIIRSTDV